MGVAFLSDGTWRMLRRFNKSIPCISAIRQLREDIMERFPLPAAYTTDLEAGVFVEDVEQLLRYILKTHEKVCKKIVVKSSFHLPPCPHLNLT